ncbi:MAG: FAD-dependent thymidylate synthase [Patescibacteria group bacterium]
MLQALYSRSPQSVTEHVKKVEETGSGKFMERYYVGYGHQSIADCGSTTLFIEKISILADKAIQDWPLYNGQETSTRYVDMSKQAIVDPINSDESKLIISKWMDFYVSSQPAVSEHIKKNYPKKPEENETVYENAVKARTFDIMRGFLPAGITTQLSWHTNLRQAWDKIALLRHNPLPEVREIAEKIHKTLKEKYANSFSHNLYDDQEKFRQYTNAKYYYYRSAVSPEFSCQTSINAVELSKYSDIISSRPLKTNLPHFLSELGLVQFDFDLDYGSFRDIQRHRNGVCRMPLLTTDKGFNAWYLDQLPDNIREKAKQLIAEQKIRITALNAAEEIKQYYISLGFNVPCRVAYGLPATVYVVELRSGKPVHPTLRKIAHQMHHALRERFPALKLHSDLEQSDWDIRRGTQTITQK